MMLFGLHLADPRQAQQPTLEIAPVGRLRPDPACVVVVVARHRCGELLDLAGHGAREPVERGPLAEHRVELGGVGRRDPRRVEVAEPALAARPDR